MEYLLRQDNHFKKTVTTFSGGIFYAKELPPGRYRAEIVPEQLHQINAVSKHKSLKFEIDTTPGVDIVDNLSFTMIPDSD